MSRRPHLASGETSRVLSKSLETSRFLGTVTGFHRGHRKDKQKRTTRVKERNIVYGIAPSVYVCVCVCMSDLSVVHIDISILSHRHSVITSSGAWHSLFGCQISSIVLLLILIVTGVLSRLVFALRCFLSLNVRINAAPIDRLCRKSLGSRSPFVIVIFFHTHDAAETKLFLPTLHTPKPHPPCIDMPLDTNTITALNDQDRI